MFIACGLLCATPAQTFVVDAANGPGTSFTSLATATATAPDGAVLLVRPGTYSTPVTIQAKSMTILADSGAVLDGFGGGVLPGQLLITGIAANQAVFVRGLRMLAGGHVQITLRCENSLGLIRVEDVSPGLLSPVAVANFEATGCASVFVHRSRFAGSCALTATDAAFVDCVLDPSSLLPTGFVQNGGIVQLTDCTVNGVTSFAGSPAVMMNGGELRLLGNTLLRGGFRLGGFNGLAIAGTGSTRLDTSVTLTGVAPVVAPTITTTTVHMPHVTIAEVAPVGSVETRLHGPQGHAGWLLASLRGQVFTLPFLTDSVWLDPNSIVLLAAGVPAAGAPVTSVIHMPSVSTQLGFEVVWQGLTLDVTGFQISNPVCFVVH